MLDWLIIGGGIHGSHLSFVLTKRLGIAHDRVGVLDPHTEPLTRWHEVTGNTGMAFLRSPQVHNLHYDQGALAVYARIHEKETYTKFIPPYARPSLELFNRHSMHLIKKYLLDTMRIRGKAEGLTRLSDGWRVETGEGGIEARNVLLAIGMSEQPRYPAWKLPSMRHIFERDFRREALPGREHIVVVGGGITAAQLALALMHDNAVTLVSRHTIRTHDFDSDPCWMNLLCLRDFYTIKDFNQRRQIIRQVRHPGSLPSDVAHDLGAAVEHGLIFHYTAEIESASEIDGQTLLALSDGNQLKAHRVLLATGYETKRPGGAWLDAAIATYGLPVADCGYPVVNETLCWQRGLYVSGPLAELEIGPASRNIVGARMAGERLLVL